MALEQQVVQVETAATPQTELPVQMQEESLQIVLVETAVLAATGLREVPQVPQVPQVPAH